MARVVCVVRFALRRTIDDSFRAAGLDEGQRGSRFGKKQIIET